MKKIVLASLLTLSLLVVAACGGGGSAAGGEVFEFGAQTYTDPKIAAQLVKIMIEEHTDHEVNITEDIQASPQILASLDRQEFDFALLFSGEVYNNYFDDVEYTTDPEQTIANAQEFFNPAYELTWFDSLGYANEYAIAVQEGFAEENDITVVSDLEQFADNVVVGTDTTWVERDNDGYRGFQEAYGFSFGDVRGMEISLMYEAIARDEVDVVTAYTVDPQIIEYDLRLLEDDVQFFPPYDASLVALNDVLEEYPEVNDIFEELVGAVSTEQMSAMIREVDFEGRSTADVAREFLEEQGFLTE
ncbi:osmoprotectant transport system substrate-binding protein [Amphibacillus marinus]|uniref:Osmoprotectant transport system substrate-binding protein n=1 Tax=Amphibacillus marinus TaxID=872970 RepID=A0A1H8R253_9BACI|nr:glycine betaine ABC transporter substrate-binding protein [Amphibacillus marinus]SEO60224.1 osmoprotectant transport system substrate-binding protein [Amphibacillus marinus]